MSGRRMLTAVALIIMAAMLAACGRLGTAGAAREADRTIYYFHETVCASCDSEGEFYEELSARLGGAALPEGWTVRCVNTFREGDELYRRACREQGIPQEDMGLPMLLTPAGAAVGQEEIWARMRELVYESCGVAGTVWYYQRPDCKDCQRVSDAVREAAAAHPECFFVEIDVTGEEEKAAFKELLGRLGIPQEEWEVPFLYNGSAWLSGYESIEEELGTIFPGG